MPILLRWITLVPFLAGCSTVVAVGEPIDASRVGDAAMTDGGTVLVPRPLGMPAIGRELAVDEPVDAPDNLVSPRIACGAADCLAAW